MFSINIELQFCPQINADFQAGGFDVTFNQKVTPAFLIPIGLILLNLRNLRTTAFSGIISLQGFKQ